MSPPELPSGDALARAPAGGAPRPRGPSREASGAAGGAPVYENRADHISIRQLAKGFAKEDALQCGFCPPGMVMSCTALLRANKNPSREETQQALCGNICRCGTYINIFRAVDSAVKAGGK